MKRKLLLFLFIISFSAQAQSLEQTTLLSQAIGTNIKEYKENSQKAYADKNYKRANSLFDSLVSHVINGSTLDNFNMRKISGRTLEFHDFDNPVFLMTYASWCTPGVGEIPALNEIARKHHKDIDFIVLYWDTKQNVKKIARKYSRKIKIVYVDELAYTNNNIIETLKHTLGFPTSFFIDANKKIVDVKRGALHHYSEKYDTSFDLNYRYFLGGISLLKTLYKEDEGIVMHAPTP
ncbi:MAG: thiol-disulfide isomerase/thioredoxin [Candidatus Paceibacteria bacterium]|jgi:thiol-disulfide isomerase/thioredoxin